MFFTASCEDHNYSFGQKMHRLYEKRLPPCPCFPTICADSWFTGGSLTLFVSVLMCLVNDKGSNRFYLIREKIFPYSFSQATIWIHQIFKPSHIQNRNASKLAPEQGWNNYLLRLSKTCFNNRIMAFSSMTCSKASHIFVSGLKAKTRQQCIGQSGVGYKPLHTKLQFNKANALYHQILKTKTRTKKTKPTPQNQNYILDR